MVPYNLQKEKHAINKDLVLRAIHDGSCRFTEIQNKTKISKRTLSKILDELEANILLIKNGEGQKIRYALTTEANEIFKAEISGFREISEAYQKWHPSLGSSGSNVMFTVGSITHFPIIQTGCISSGMKDIEGNPKQPLNEFNIPDDKFVTSSDLIEGIVHEGIMNSIIMQGDSHYQNKFQGKHGKQHIAVVIDYDLLQSYFDMADGFENVITSGEGLTLFYSKKLDINLESDPIRQEMLKTGMMGYSEFYESLSNRQKNAFLISEGELPVVLKIILFPKQKEDRSTLMRAIGKAIDGSFIELIDVYSKKYGNFPSNLKNLNGSTIREKVISLYGGEGIAKPTDIMEFASILLLDSLRRYGMMKDSPSNESEMKKIFSLIAYWGTHYMFQGWDNSNKQQ